MSLMAIGLAVVALLALITFALSCFTVEQQNEAIIERFSKFRRTAGPGLHGKMPWIDHIAQRVSLKIQQLIIEVETKTKDNVFVKVHVSVQYRVMVGKVKEAYYELQNPVEQIKAYVLDVVRAQVPKMVLDDVFEKKNDIAEAVKKDLDTEIGKYGYEIPAALVTDVDPAQGVKNAMNEIQTQQRLQVAAAAKGEGEKILIVKAAEAEAESKALQGKGIANERKAIIDGLRESIEAFKAAVQGATESDVMQLVLLTQYFDTMKAIGTSQGSRVIFLPHSPGGMADLAAQIRDAVTMGNEAGGKGGADTGAHTMVNGQAA